MKNAKNITSKTLKWTLLAASREFTIGRETLRRRLARCGFKPDEAAHYTTPQIFEALSGSLETSRIRESEARTKLLEMEHKEKSGESMPVDDVKDYMVRCYAPIREAVISMPIQQGALCNPSDPDHAIATLEEWVREFFARVNKPFTEIVAESKSTAPDKP